MGQARQRKIALANRPPLDIQSIEKVGRAIRKLATAASSHLGSDCHLHASLGKQLLLKLGIESEVVSGYAAWRVGQSDGAVVSHTARNTGYLPPGAQGFEYHTWLLAGESIIDLTTYQLRKKIAQLDALDGGNTVVQWCPDVLVIERHQVKTYKQVAQDNTGDVYYERNAAVEAKLSNGFALDHEDIAAAMLILEHDDIQVIGPNDMPQ